jgi:hypothetical protein
VGRIAFFSSPLNHRRQTRAPRADHETPRYYFAIRLAIGLIASTFAEQKEPSLSEQDRAQIVEEAHRGNGRDALDYVKGDAALVAREAVRGTAERPRRDG